MALSAILSDRGLDTVRFRWREDSSIYDLFGRRAEGYQQGYHGEKFVQTQLGRLGVYPDGLVYLEGRAKALSVWNRDEHELLPPHHVLSAEQGAREWARENGAPISEAAATLGRIDLASELRFSSGVEGGAFLHSLAALDVPWCKSRVDGRKGDSIETVSFHGVRGKTIYLRAYDKGVESGTAAPGKRIRVERQKRFRKTREPMAADLNVVDLRKWYIGREFEKLSDLPSSTVVDIRGALSVLMEAEYLTGAEKLRLAGYSVLGRYLEEAGEIPSRSARRYRAELRSAGISLDPTQVGRLEVPVGRYLQTLGAAWAA